MDYLLYLLIDQCKYDNNIYHTKVGVYNPSDKNTLDRYKTLVPTAKLVYTTPILLSYDQARELEQNILTHFTDYWEDGASWIERHHMYLIQYVSKLINEIIQMRNSSEKMPLFTIYEEVDDKYILSDTKTFKFDTEDVDLETVVTYENKVLYPSKLHNLMYYHFNVPEYINLLYENKMLKEKPNNNELVETFKNEQNVKMLSVGNKSEDQDIKQLTGKYYRLYADYVKNVFQYHEDNNLYSVNYKLLKTTDLVDCFININNIQSKSWYFKNVYVYIMQRNDLTEETINLVNETASKEGIKQLIIESQHSVMYVDTNFLSKVLRYLPKEYITEELCRIAVSQDGNSIEYVPVEYITEELCKIAVSQNGCALKFVLKKYKTNEVCKMAVSQDVHAIEFVPDKFRTEELCEIVVSKNGMLLEYVLNIYKTEEICKIAVSQNGRALQFVPDKYKTEEICKIAVLQDGYALKFVPDENVTEEMCKIAVSQDGSALEFVPEEYLTEEMCKIATLQNSNAFHHVPIDYMTEEMYKTALLNEKYRLSSIPYEYRTEELCKIAVSQDGNALEFVPDKYITEELCKIAVSQDGFALEFVPEKYITEELCKIAVSKDGRVLKFVPEKYITEELSIIILS